MSESRMALNTESPKLVLSSISVPLPQPKNMAFALSVRAEFTLEREKGKATQLFFSLGSACFKHGFLLKIHLFGLSLISSTKEQNAIPLHQKTFNHIYSLFEQIYRSSNCNKEKTQMIAKFG